MDYSLLIGVDEENQELVFGIIDYLSPYNWKKNVESFVKPERLALVGAKKLGHQYNLPCLCIINAFKYM